MIALGLMMMILNWFHMCLIISKGMSIGTMEALRAMSLEYLIDEIDKYGLSNDIPCHTLLTKAPKPDFESIRNKFLFAQAQTITKIFAPTTQFLNTGTY